jgi:hypothetical protein
MADERDEEKSDETETDGKRQATGGQQSHKSEYGEQSETIGGQPIGGNDSRTGSGTPLTQGYGGAEDTGGGLGTPGSEQGGGQSSRDETQTGTGSVPPRSMGTRGTEFGSFGDATGPAGQQGQSGTGQADLGSQAGSTLAGRSDQQDLGDIGGEVDQPASYGGGIGGDQPDTAGEGFIAAQGAGTDDELQASQRPSSASATGGSDFAPQGRGATEEEEDEASSEGQSI